MPEYKIIMPSQPRIVSEEGNKGVFEIDGLYPGYGHTLGNSLRRIILSSLPGASITSLKIDGVTHEFQSMDGIKEVTLDCPHCKFSFHVFYTSTGFELRAARLKVLFEKYPHFRQ